MGEGVGEGAGAGGRGVMGCTYCVGVDRSLV